MATVTTQSITNAGAATTYSAASPGGDRFLPADGTFLHVKNGSGSPITVTLVTPGTVDGLAITDRAVSVPATSERFIAVPDSLYRSSDGLADITWSATTTVTFAVVRI